MLVNDQSQSFSDKYLTNRAPNIYAPTSCNKFMINETLQ